MSIARHATVWPSPFVMRAKASFDRGTNKHLNGSGRLFMMSDVREQALSTERCCVPYCDAGELDGLFDIDAVPVLRLRDVVDC